MDREENKNYRKLFLLSIIAVVVMFILSGYVWLQIGIEDEVCAGWNIVGDCGGKLLGVFAVPTLTAVTLGSLYWFFRIEPRQRHLAQSHKALTTIWAMWLVFFFVVQTVLLLNLLGREPAIATYWPILAGVVSLVMGNYLGKIRSNTIAGFRTPWTLASELSWNKTHRLGGRLLFVLGLVLIAGPLIIMGDFWAYFIIVASLLWVVVLALYSYTIWKRDPHHTRPEWSPKT